MKTKLSFLILIIALVCGCQKEKPVQKELELTDFTITPAGTVAQVALTATYPGKLTATLKVSRSEDMSDAIIFVLEKESTEEESFTFVFTINELLKVTDYWCQVEVGNAYFSKKTEVKMFTTLDDNIVVTTNEVTDIGFDSAKCGGSVIADESFSILSRGICWSTDSNPTLENAEHETSGNGTGEFSITLTDLMPNTKYYVRAYATNNVGTCYGMEKSFTTEDDDLIVTTDDISEITATSAICSGNVTSDGGFSITERGFCWSTDSNPTLENAEHETSGNGTGEFSITLTDLMPNTKYYVRAYATNNVGTTYAQEEKTFSTRDGIVKVITGNVSNISTTSAKCNGNVIDDGGSVVTERGFCWSTDSNPTLENAEHETSGNGMGEFSITITGLEESTTYYICAYAINSYGTRYGEMFIFNTLMAPITFTVNDINFRMFPVEGGTFTMGATPEQGSNVPDNEKPTHSVTLSDFYIGKYEVTQALWQAVMGNNPSNFSNSLAPVEMVSWNDCQEFITKLNEMCASQLNSRRFALPTEAEWEYAARGGAQSQGYKYSGSNTLDNVAWFLDNSYNITHAVGYKVANELGLRDMSGNVWEWCQDWYSSYSSDAQINPTGPLSGSRRVLRGGSWINSENGCRVSYRSSSAPDSHNNHLGLRLVLR